jgi:4,5-DOPA dioxygenase extradiol
VDFAENASPAPWAIEFDEQIKNALLARDDASIISYEKFGTAARRSVPTNDHFLPLLYTLGSTEKNEETHFTYEGIEHASLSMRCVRFGA